MSFRLSSKVIILVLYYFCFGFSVFLLGFGVINLIGNSDSLKHLLFAVGCWFGSLLFFICVLVLDNAMFLRGVDL